MSEQDPHQSPIQIIPTSVSVLSPSVAATLHDLYL
nr:MAG TPA: hypothetical protein [Caudoviricetes sp.]